MRLVTCLSRLFLLAMPTLTQAQKADSIPFRARQWGAEFRPGSSFGSAGLLRFRSSHIALLFDLGAGYDDNRQDGSGERGITTQLGLRIGQRWYRAFAPLVFRFAAIGPSVNYLRIEGTDEGAFGGQHRHEQRSTMIGLFGELGAGWFVTPQPSLAAVWSTVTSYKRSANSDAIGESELRWNSSGFAATLGSVSMRVGLYF